MVGSIFVTQVASLINFWSAARKLPITFIDEIKDKKEIRKVLINQKPVSYEVVQIWKNCFKFTFATQGKLLGINYLKQNFAEDIFCQIYFYKFNPKSQN